MAVVEKEVAGGAPEEPSAARDKALRAILDKIAAASGGRIRAKAKDLAEELGVNPQTFRVWLSRWVADGVLETRSLGRSGTLISAGRGKPRRGRAASHTRAARGSEFCIWCGTRAVRGARFCGRCGKPLPK